MNMLGNLAGFAAPVIGGFILERQSETGGWAFLIDTMLGAALVSASCWFFLDPEATGDQEGRTSATATSDSAPS